MALLYSYLFVFGIIGLSTLLLKTGLLGEEGSRKLIHIGVGNWIVLAYFLFDNLLIALIGPATFVVLNYLSYRFHWISAMERTNEEQESLGTVFYAISLFFVVLADYLLFGAWQVSLLPILILAYGDGCSALVGMNVSSITLVHNKTLAGAITMFVISLILGFLTLNTLWIIVVVAVVATLIELFSPKGFDNLTVPLGLYLILWVIV